MFFDGGVNLPRKSRKYRQLDDDPSDGGGSDARPADVTLDQDRIAPKATSYKGSLLQNSTSLPSESDELMDEEDIIFEDGEVVRNIVDGVISIDLSERVLSLTEKSLEYTVVVKLLGCRIGYNTLRTKIYELWKPSQPIKLMDIENDYFLVSFRTQFDYERILSSGPWTVANKHLSDSIPLPFPDRTSPLEEPPDKHAPPSQLPALRILVDTSQQYTQNVDANDETNTAQAVATLENDIAWSLGADNFIHPLTDTWISAVGPLCAHLNPDSLLFLAITFSDLLDVNGNWDHEKLAAIFHPNVVPHILGVKCPDPNDSDDKLIWRWTPNADKTTLHVLRDCSAASAVWQQLVPQRIFPGHLFFYQHYGSYGKVQTSLTVQTPRDPILWKRPEPGWTCLNVNGAVSSVNGIGSIGGLL
ncbi:hypothetical protein V6N11_015622 [Hibiscus sabdariffa]|uniref:DUF4283 domain-containing protein n=1 Tax=Hibiscus sabdariffa TaxID=183260 RepID=A0ABR2TSN5_9ROSI